MYMLLTNSHQWHLYYVNYMALTPSKQEPGLQRRHLNCKLLINLTPTRLQPDSNLHEPSVAQAGTYRNWGYLSHPCNLLASYPCQENHLTIIKVLSPLVAIIMY